MKIVFDIPKEFEAHFKEDKFKDSLDRVRYDIKSIIGKGGGVSWNYELETIDMLIKAFEESKPIEQFLAKSKIADLKQAVEESKNNLESLDDENSTEKLDGVDEDELG